MRAVVVRGVSQVAVETVEDALIEAPTDALLRVTAAALCGSDLHIYEGRMGVVVADMVIGREPLGVVEEVGRAVPSIRRGDRVTVPTHICCGFCQNCVRGYSDACRIGSAEADRALISTGALRTVRPPPHPDQRNQADQRHDRITNDAPGRVESSVKQ